MGERILTVPLDRVVHPYLALQTPVGKELIAQGHITDKNMKFWTNTQSLLAVYLVSELHKMREDPDYQGLHNSFIEILPEDTSEFPTCYTDEELKYLEGSPTTHIIIAA